MSACRPIAVILIAALAVCAALYQPPQRASAKGPSYITIGGGGLGRAYYAIPEPGPVNGWGGLLPNDPATDEPAGRIAAPADVPAMLRGAYELYWDDLGFRGGPHGYYVPRTAAHGPELYWSTPSGGMDFVAWFALNDVATTYLDRAIVDARAAKAARGTYPDWISAMLRDPYYAGPPGVVSDGYRLTAYEDAPGAAPLGTFVGAQATQLFREYAATLHHWHPLPLHGINGYKVYTSAGREVFTYAPASATAPAQVMPAEAGGVFDATPKLSQMIDRALGPDRAPGARVMDDRGESRSSRRALLAAAIVATGFAWLLTGATALQRRRAHA